MEVHHHAHTSRKKWTHYFWEFIMLFLAVFCGFLAEYQLEHKIEKDRERQYIKSLINDLRADTVQLNARSKFRMDKLKTLDTLLYLLKSKELSAHTGTLYYHGFLGVFGVKFLPNNSVLSQLKNAGGLRLIRKQSVVDSLLYLDIETQWIVDFENWERERLIDFSPYENVLDASVFEKHLDYQFPQGVFTLGRITDNPPLLTYKKEELDRFYNRVQLQKRLNIVLINRFYRLKLRIIQLMDQIKKAYKIE